MEYYTNLIFKISLFMVALLAFWSGLVYRLYRLDWAGIIVSLILALLSFTIILYLARKFNFFAKRKTRLATLFSSGKTELFNRTRLILASLYTVLFIILLRLLIASGVDAAVISPWQSVPPIFFIIFILATIILITLALTGFRYILALVIAHFGLMITVAHFVFPLGFGFDPFIHQATLEKIAIDGQVLPKPAYYLGQYGLIIILHKLFYIPLVFLNKYLVPLAAMAFVPYAVKKAVGQWTRDKRLIAVTVILCLALPLGIFTISTPQNLAYIFLLLAVLLSIGCKNWLDLTLVYSLSLAASVIHPIAGIPAVLWSLLLTVHHSDIKHFKKSFYRIILSAAVAALPLAFYYINYRAIDPAAINHGLALGELSLFSWPVDFLPNSENIILNTVYFYIFNIKLLAFLIVTTGIYISWRYRDQLKLFGLFLSMSLAMLASYLLCSLLPFNFLIDYERSDFADRILIVAGIFLFPLMLVAFYALARKISAAPKNIKVIFLFFIALAVSVSLYSSYPRYDNYHNSHSYSLSRSDLNAVAWIEDNAGSDYIVLANQQVSAAALKTYGFKKYYVVGSPAQEIFYYPIPTGSLLYQYYLDMVYGSPSREIMNQAMDLAAVGESYFVVNKYWWAFDKVVAEAKLTADSYEIIDNGEIYIFKYTK